MTAAAEGHVEVVKACLPEVSSVDVHVRLARSSNSQATTPLHAASSSGHVEVVKLLLEWQADVTGGHGHLKALTPLHEAATQEVAALLLRAGASPFSLDTREPDLVWYHKQRRRHAVAALVDARRSQLKAELRAARPPRGVSPRQQASPAGQERPRGIAAIQPFARVEVAAARSAWRFAVTGADGRIFDCTICMSQVQPGEEALLLPCAASSRSDGGRANVVGAALPESPHIFHFSCLEPWFLRKAGACPTCRCDLRRLLRQGAR